MNSTDPGDQFVQRPDTAQYETQEPVLYEAKDGIATLTMYEHPAIAPIG